MAFLLYSFMASYERNVLFQTVSFQGPCEATSLEVNAFLMTVLSAQKWKDNSSRLGFRYLNTWPSSQHKQQPCRTFGSGHTHHPPCWSCTISLFWPKKLGLFVCFFNLHEATRLLKALWYWYAGNVFFSSTSQRETQSLMWKALKIHISVVSHPAPQKQAAAAVCWGWAGTGRCGGESQPPGTTLQSGKCS